MRLRPKQNALRRRPDGRSKKSPRSVSGATIDGSLLSTPAFSGAFDKAKEGMLILDRKGRCREVNRAAAKMLGLRKNLMRNKPIDIILAKYTVAGRPVTVEALKGELLLVHEAKAKIAIRTRAVDFSGGLSLLVLRRKDRLPARESEAWKVDRASLVLPEFFPLPPSEEEPDFRSLFQHSPYGTCILQNNSIVVANPMFCKLLGYRASDEIVGKEIRQFLDGGSHMLFSLLQQRAFRGETIPARFEIRMLRENGTTIDVESTMSLSLYRDAPALNLSINDVTDRKELERRLTDSEGLLRNVINSMVDALVITDLQGKVLDVNDEFERFTGFSRRDAFGVEIPYPWVPEEDLRSYIGWLEKLRENNVLRDFDITWLRKSGERIAVSLNTTMLRNSAGDPVLMVNIARDITERQTSREELSRQVRRLQVLYELSRALTETFDTREIARITFQQIEKVIPVDAFFIDRFDEKRNLLRAIYNVDVFEGKRIESDARGAEVPLDERTASAKVIRDRKPLLELRPEAPSGPVYVPFGNPNRGAASLMFVPMFSRDRTIGVMSVQSYEPNIYSNDHLTLLESIANVVGIAIEKAILYQETITKSQEIEARNKELDDFTYVVSHDLKEPLISVEGYTKIIRHEYLNLFDEAGREYLQSVMDSCIHMKRLIDELLQLSRIAKLSEKKAKIDSAKLIHDVLEELQFSIRERKAEIVLQQDLPPIDGVDTYMRIVFRNLLSNALKFCDKPQPRIEIGASATEDEVVYFIKDNGIGIEPEYFEKIFMIFQRLHKKDEYEGAGAGLTIVKKIVASHGGRIWVDSVRGQGSTFYFTIPVS